MGGSIERGDSGGDRRDAMGNADERGDRSQIGDLANRGAGPANRSRSPQSDGGDRSDGADLAHRGELVDLADLVDLANRDTNAKLADLADVSDRNATVELVMVGAALRGAGLHARGLAAWAGTARIAALPARVAALPAAETPAAALLALFVAGAEVPRDRLRLPEAAIEALIAWRLVDRDAGRLRARLAIVPLGAALLVCDRLDAPVDRALVCWPDDSSHHLAAAIPPGRRADWLDLGCGSAFAPLARPELAAQIAGVDLNPRAVRCARLGAALSGLASQIAASVGDIAEPQPPAALVTCNAPMPDAATDDRLRRALPEIWRRADPDFFARLWPALARAVRPGGLVVVHAACDAVLPALEAARGERVAAIYTPEGVPGFAVAWWQPDAADRLAVARRALTAERPHIDPRDREDALTA